MCVAVSRSVAAANVPTNEAYSGLYPSLAHRDAFFTSLCVGCHLLYQRYVGACLGMDVQALGRHVVEFSGGGFRISPSHCPERPRYQHYLQRKCGQQHADNSQWGQERSSRADDHHADQGADPYANQLALPGRKMYAQQRGEV